MCGIVGYIGKKDAVDFVIQGLKRLEYRGYDSAGLATIADNRINVIRSVGKLNNLDKKLSNSNLTGNIGIGHTRWATHGEPSERNAHPHLDCNDQTVIIHNGIVENFLELKEKLLTKGHIFRSETDSEVIAHLVEDAWKDVSEDELIERTGKILMQLEGAHAIIIMSLRFPDRIIAVRIGNAGGIAIGEGDEGYFLASDIPAILPYTREMIFLEDREIADIRISGFNCFNLQGKQIAKEYFKISWDPVSAARGNFTHFMQKEICEQPLSLTDTLRNRINFSENRVNFKHFDISSSTINRFRKIIIVACGTSYYAGLVGKYMIEDLAKIQVEVDYGSEFRYRKPLIDDKTLVLALSQSGETVDTLAAIEEAKSKGAKLAAIVNVPGSQISRICQGIIYMHAGPEIGVASTKAFTSTLVDLFLLAIHIARIKNSVSDERVSFLLNSIVKLPKLAGEILKDKSIYLELANQYYEATDFLYLGRGINFPIALEGAHKLKEISYIHAEGCPAGEMKHGINALIDRHLPVVAIAPKDFLYQKMLSNIQQVKARDGKIISLVSEARDDIKRFSDYVIEVPFLDSLINPILNVIPLQMLAYYIALKRGCDIDQPRNLAKSVTVE